MKTRIFGPILCILLVINSCTTEVNPTFIPTASWTPTFSTSNTVSSLETMDTSTIPSPMSTARETVVPEDMVSTLNELMQRNMDCSRPCFWGITPGITSFSEATDYVDSLGAKALTGVIDARRYYNTILHYRNTGTIGLVFTEKNGIVDTINVGVEGLQDPGIPSSDWLAFHPDSILKTYGTPSNINVILGEGPNGVIGYELLISYDNPSFFIKYTMEDSINRPNKILHTCPLAESGIRGFDFSIGQDNFIPIASLYSMNELTNYSVQEFSTLLTTKGDAACFDFDISPFYK